MTDEQLDTIWAEHFGPVFRPQKAFACMRAVAEAEREACAVLAESAKGDRRYAAFGVAYVMAMLPDAIASAIRARGGSNV